MLLSQFVGSTTWPLQLFILLGVSVIIPVLLSVFKLKIIPSLVIEILAGMGLAFIPQIRELFFIEGEGVHLQSFPQILYVLGMSILLFLSGLDADFSVFKVPEKKAHKTFKVLLFSVIAFVITVILSFLLALLFAGRMHEEEKIFGLVFLTILFSSTFASLVIPLVHDAGLGETTIGMIIGTYATLAELVSIVALSITIVALEGFELKTILGLGAIILIGVLIFVFKKWINFEKIFGKKMEGIVFLSTRVIVLILFAGIFFSDMAGFEYILGAFLSGMLLRALHISHSEIHKVEVLGYGLFVPMFYILVGFICGAEINESASEFASNYELIGLVFVVFLVMVIAKAPFLYLFKFFKTKTAFPSLFIVSSTIIVAITVNEFSGELFKESVFGNVLLLASLITVVLPPIIFGNTADFSEAKEPYHDYIIELIDLEVNELELIDNFGNDSMVEIELKFVPDYLREKKLSDVKLKDTYGINIIAVKRHGHRIEVNRDLMIEEHDDLIVFGGYKEIEELFKDNILKTDIVK